MLKTSETVSFHPHFTIYLSGADPGIWEKGGAQHTIFFGTAASLETRASPKKADKRGGGGGDSDTFFFPERHLRRGGGGG